VVPSVFVLSAPVLAAVRGAWNVRVLFTAFVAGNLLYAVAQLGSDPGLPGRILANDLQALVSRPGDGSALGRVAPDGWTLSASHRPHRAGWAADGRFDTSWATRRPQEPGMHFQVDLGAIQTVAGVWLWSAASEYPRRYTVTASLDGTAWHRLAGGRGDRRLVGFLDVTPAVAIRFAAQPARYLRITQDGRDASRGWAITELAVATRAR
ncbi:MAG: discoidin domain-containing protein, partial [Candidatus Rokuibacteriota bacterium]